MRNALLTGLLALTACAQKPDYTQDFGIARDNRPMRWTAGAALGLIQETESGFNTATHFTILFPAPMSPIPRPGLQITIDPARAKIVLGQPQTFGGGVEGISAEYALLATARGVQTFDSVATGGSLTIRFDVFEAKEGGRVQGRLLKAVMPGFFEGADGRSAEDKEPTSLELWNIPFDVALKYERY
ncbi:MAG: hypothetical protein AAB320_04030 [Elusimicrobiota bacterium]